MLNKKAFQPLAHVSMYGLLVEHIWILLRRRAEARGSPCAWVGRWGVPKWTSLNRSIGSHVACDRPITSWVVATCRTPLPREQTDRHDWKHYMVKAWFNYSLVFIESIVLTMMMLAWWLFAVNTVNNLIVQNTVWHNRTPEQVLLFDVLWCVITHSNFSLIDFNLIRLWVSIHFISHFLKYIHA